MAEYMASMPLMPLTPGMTIRFTAVDATTGAEISGVQVSDATIYVTDTKGGVDTLALDGDPTWVWGDAPEQVA